MVQLTFFKKSFYFILYFILFILVLILFYVYVSFACAYVCLLPACLVPIKTQRCCLCPGTRITEVGDLPCELMEANSGAPEKKPQSMINF